MDETERLSQEDKCNKERVGGVLEQAELIARRVLESIQALAGTTTCKGVQIAQLTKWAKANGYWILSDDLGTFEDRGSENEVDLSRSENLVYKLNDFRYSDDNLTPFFERIEAHNFYFPDCAYTLVGFSENKEGNVCAVLRQPYILSSREATDREITDELVKLGFMSQTDGEYFTNGTHDIFDASPNNVLVGIDGNLYFIDTIIYKTSADNVCIFQNQSPRYSGRP